MLIDSYVGKARDFPRNKVDGTFDGVDVVFHHIHDSSDEDLKSIMAEINFDQGAFSQRLGHMVYNLLERRGIV